MFFFLAIAFTLAAASTGTAIPCLKRLVVTHPSLLGPSGFVTAHVAGGILAAWIIRRHGATVLTSPTFFVRMCLALSVLLNLCMVVTTNGNGLLLLRWCEGLAHVSVIATLMSISQGSGVQRRRRTAKLGALLVLGIAAGIGLGGMLANRGGSQTSFVLSAFLAGLALAVLPRLPRADLQPVLVGKESEPPSNVMAPALVVLAERFSMGLLTIVIPLLCTSTRHAATLLGTLMLASVIGIPLARRLAERVGCRRVWNGGALLFSIAMLASMFGIHGSPLVAAGWAICVGLSAAAVFAGALMNISDAPERERLAGMGMIHSFGAVGFLLGTATAGALLQLVSERALVAVPTIGAPVMLLALAAVALAAPRERALTLAAQDHR